MNTPHNPDNLTPAQYGASEGWRLLDEDEIVSETKRFPKLRAIQSCCKYPPRWVANCIGNDTDVTYRTQKSRPELRAARGLPPEQEPVCQRPERMTVHVKFPCGC